MRMCGQKGCGQSYRPNVSGFLTAFQSIPKMDPLKFIMTENITARQGARPLPDIAHFISCPQAL